MCACVCVCVHACVVWCGAICCCVTCTQTSRGLLGRWDGERERVRLCGFASCCCCSCCSSSLASSLASSPSSDDSSPSSSSSSSSSRMALTSRSSAFASARDTCALCGLVLLPARGGGGGGAAWEDGGVCAERDAAGSGFAGSADVELLLISPLLPPCTGVKGEGRLCPAASASAALAADGWRSEDESGAVAASGGGAEPWPRPADPVEESGVTGENSPSDSRRGCDSFPIEPRLMRRGEDICA